MPSELGKRPKWTPQVLMWVQFFSFYVPLAKKSKFIEKLNWLSLFGQNPCSELLLLQTQQLILLFCGDCSHIWVQNWNWHDLCTFRPNFLELFWEYPSRIPKNPNILGQPQKNTPTHTSIKKYPPKSPLFCGYKKLNSKFLGFTPVFWGYPKNTPKFWDAPQFPGWFFFLGAPRVITAFFNFETCCFYCFDPVTISSHGFWKE